MRAVLPRFTPQGGAAAAKSSAAGWTLLALTPTCVAWALRADVPKEYIKHAKDCDAAVPGSVGDVQHVLVRAVRKRVRDEIDRPRSLHTRRPRPGPARAPLISELVQLGLERRVDQERLGPRPAVRDRED